MKKKKIIVSDPGDEITHIYEPTAHSNPDQIVSCAGATQQMEGINSAPTIKPYFINNYGE